ncbi:glycosyltransferase family 4 protein [bacterium]|nr:glycosyltransferase family 4 protein [bacterium]
MKILIISHSAVVPVYREKYHLLAGYGCEVHLVLPTGWPEGGRWVEAPKSGEEKGIHIHRLPGRFLGRVGGFYLIGLKRRIKKIAPDILHVEEEPYSLVCAQALRIAKKLAIPFVFFTWENIYRPYKPLLNWIDNWVLKNSRWAIAGNREAGLVLKKRGYQGNCDVIPQYGVDPDVFRPFAVMNAVHHKFTIGYFGRLIEEKGLVTLLKAVRELKFDWNLIITGNGELRDVLKKTAAEFGVLEKIRFVTAVDNKKVPHSIQQLDVLVLPSETRDHWKEQFGRVLIEAMACEVPVVGSDSGEIPHVIADTGMVFPEGDWQALTGKLISVHQDAPASLRLGRKGRLRVLDHYTTGRISLQMYAFYKKMFKKD